MQSFFSSKRMGLYQTIIQKKALGQKQFAVLIDPEKSSLSHLETLLKKVEKAQVDMILLGGSTMESSSELILSQIRRLSDKPVILFPGNVSQITPGVDAIFFLSLISGRNPDYLIGHHVKAAPLLKGMEVIPVAYLLLDGGRLSATQRVSRTEPLSCQDVDLIVHTALAGQMLGHKMVYLEAGSGAKVPVPEQVIKAVRAQIEVPLIVGGGLKNAGDIEAAYRSGADVVVVGNALEHNPDLLLQLSPQES